jgi:hypothetical protein
MHYRTSLPDAKRNLHRAGILPTNMAIKEPVSYRLWRMCEDHDTLWWDGGIARQPYVLMLEFQACRLAQAEFLEWLKDITQAQQAADEHLRSLTGGYHHRLGGRPQGMAPPPS